MSDTSGANSQGGQTPTLPSSNLFGGNAAYNPANPTTALPSTGGAQEAPPSAAQSAYQFQNYVAGANVVLGPTIAQLLGLSATQTYTGDEIINAYYDMPHGDLISLQNYLYNSGEYASEEGTAMTGRPVFGSYDNDGFMAISQAILDTQNDTSAKGISNMSTYLQQQITSGAGLLKQESALNPISGGGNTYQVTTDSGDTL